MPDLTSSSRTSSSEKLSGDSKFRLSPLRRFNPLSEIEFVPSNVPRHRRLQTFAVAMWALLIPICMAVFYLFFSIPALWPFLVLYCIFIAFDGAPEHGGRSSQWVRSMRIWRYFVEYYPATLKKETDLPPDRPYVFGYHPHGIIGIHHLYRFYRSLCSCVAPLCCIVQGGALATFATEGTGFSQQFPGISPHLLTLTSNFRIPFYREIIMMMGICSVSKRSCVNVLRQGKGSAICIVIGGAAESLAARPGTADLTLRKRLGFIKIAMQQGADLVPVFSFGENDIYEQMSNEKGTVVYTIQKKFQAILGFTFPLFHGRGLLNYNFGLMPHRRAIVTVVGRPISVQQHDKPTMDMIAEVQERYIEELLRIWNTYKDSYARHRKQELRIVE